MSHNLPRFGSWNRGRRTTRIRLVTWLGVLLTLYSTTQAQDAEARTSIATKDDLWVGQRLPFIVELLVPGYFSGTPAFDLPEVPGLLLIPSAGSPVIGSEEDDGVTYTVQRHELSVFAHRSGDFTIPTFPVRLAFKRHPLDAQPVTETVDTQPITFAAKTPPGAQITGALISTTSLTANETWRPPLQGKAKVGDAFIRTVTFTATDVPAMAFPPFLAAQVDGIAVYAKPAEVRDHAERGELRGERNQVITYLCEQPGRFTIPGARFTWWNLESKQLETIDFPARSLDVAPNSAFASEARQTARSADWNSKAFFSLVALMAVLATTATAAWKYRQPLKQLFRDAGNFLRPTRLAPLNPTRDKRRLS